MNSASEHPFLSLLREGCDELLPPDQSTIIVAVSGGADSMALFHGLVALNRWYIVVSHMDHGLRPESADEARMIQEVVDHYQIHGASLSGEFHRCDVAELARKTSVGLEEAGRRARYALFAEIAAKYDASVVVTAHHRNDQAETVMANILRGSGPVGLGGMPRRRALTQDCKIVRPLLKASHRECCDYLSSNGFDWAEDRSNADRTFWRNRLRHDVLPALEAGVPGFIEELLAFSHRQHDMVQRDIQEAVALFSRSEGEKGLRAESLLEAPQELRYLVWRHLAQSLSLPMERRTLRQLDNLLHGKVGRRFEVGSYSFLRRPKWVSWEIYERNLPEVYDPVPAEGTLKVYQGELSIRQKIEVVDVVASPNEAFINAAEVEGALHWRLPKEGERWRPFGSEGRKPVLRYLADRGVPSHARRVKGLLADDAGVVWIPGFTIADRVQVFPQTDDIFHIRFHPEKPSQKNDDLFI